MVSTSAENPNTPSMVSSVAEDSFAGATSPFDYKNLIEGNARLIGLSNRLLGAHIAHAGLIMFWAGSITVSQAINYNPALPLDEQGLSLISNLARLGWGLDEGGQVASLYPYFVIGMLHLVASAVLGAGGLFHVFGGPKSLKDADGWAKKFHYEWDDPKQLTLILGHHLLFLGAAALAFVAKATRFGGVYDPAIGQVRLVTPNLNPIDIFGYLVGLTPDGWNVWGIASVNNLEDVIGGHVWIGVLLIGGGIWHILVNAKIIFPIRLNADAILSYSLGSLAFMAFVSWAFVSYNTTVFPPNLYGTMQLRGRAAVQLGLGILFLGGHLWHAYRGIAADEGKPPVSLTEVS
ncbi:MAG: chlorophyll a/b binding light-harvesting protein [Cyanobacteria bacterium J06621_3]